MPLSQDQIDNAGLDCDTIGDVATGNETLNGDGTTTNRLGDKIKTIRRVIYDAVQYLQSAGVQSATQAATYATAAAGLAATPAGKYFLVAGSGDKYADLYLNNAGASLYVASVPSLVLAKKGYNPLLVSKALSWPWEDFDRLEGTIVAGMTSQSGHAFSITGPGGATAFIKDNALNNSNNIYFSPGTSDQLVTEAWGVVEWATIGTGGMTSQEAVLMFNGTGPVDLNKLIHVEFYNVGGALPKITLTGPANLRVLNGTVTEVDNCPGNPVIPTDGEPRAIALRFVQKSDPTLDELYVTTGAGRTYKFVGDTDMRTVMSGCYWTTGQIGPSFVANGTIPRWRGIGCGPRRAKVTTALGGYYPDARVVKQLTGKVGGVFDLKRRVLIKPTATGWYAIANGLKPSVTTFMGGEMTLVGNEHGGRFTNARVAFGLEFGGQLRVESMECPIGIFSGTTVVQQFRVSSDGNQSGVMQLEVFIQVYGQSDDYTAIDLNGFFSVIENPVVGSVPLASQVRTRRLNLSKNIATAGGDANFTLTPGLNSVKNDVSALLSAARTITLDDTNAIEGDEFILIRRATAANSYNVINGSDSAALKTLAPATWAKFGLQGGKFALMEYGGL